MRRALAVVTAAAACGVAAYVAHRMAIQVRALRASVARLEAQVEKERVSRKAERQGRTRAERNLRQAQGGHAPGFDETASAAAAAAVEPKWRKGAGGGRAEGGDQPGSSSAAATSQLAFAPIGVCRSCFSRRNGTPRQPLLVPAAVARIELDAWVPPLALDGLAGYSHAWVLYIFHANTDGLDMLQQSAGAALKQGATFRAKVRVPRLDGGKMGVLATRSPHRPVPIGLSLVKIESVRGRFVTISGADIVDGSPVVDIKPYLPFCESLPHATAPDWVTEEAPCEPLHIASVGFAAGAEAALQLAWGRSRVQLSRDAAAFVQLVRQVLARDLRPYHKRAGEASSEGTSEVPAEQLRVILEEVEVTYELRGGSRELTVLAARGAPKAAA